MLWNLLAQIALQLVGLIVKRQEDKDAWKKAIQEKLDSLERRSLDSAQIREEYERLQEVLRAQQTNGGTVPPKEK
jgi:hypothetical protein